jgi:hypothetical protein
MRAPSPKEQDIHLALAQLLQQALAPNWIYYHTPNGEKRAKATAALLKAMGVKPGVADFTFIGPGPHIVFLELKREGGTLSKAQQEFRAHVRACGCTYHLAYDLEDAIGTLRDLGIVRAQVSA